MISNSDIKNKARQWQLEEHIIEKDYVLGWVLWGIANHPILSKSWVLKGGTCIKKCYVDTHRYSQDLDFTVLPGGPWQPDELQTIFTEVVELVRRESGIDLGTQQPKFEIRPHGGSTEAKIYYVGPCQNPNVTGLKIDITLAEILVRPPVLRPIGHPYPDSFSRSAQMYTYSLEELFSEKIRALGERQRPGDLYDIIHLFRRSDLHAEPALIAEILEAKCNIKEIPVPSLDVISSSEARIEMQKRWQSMLGKGLGAVPDFESYWSELPSFFAWLNGEEHTIEIQEIDPDLAWEAPSIEWQRGQSEWLEPIRYAAANQLLINLGYKSEQRLVEPYSLRSTRGGDLLFYALKANTRQIRSYRVDRIQAIEVTNQPFRPVFRIEFTPKGRINVPLTQRQRRFTSNWSMRKYVIACAVCGKTFRREKYSLTIQSHKRQGTNSPCHGRHGYLA